MDFAAKAEQLTQEVYSVILHTTRSTQRKRELEELRKKAKRLYLSLSVRDILQVEITPIPHKPKLDDASFLKSCGIRKFKGIRTPIGKRR